MNRGERKEKIMEENEIATIVIGEAIYVHKILGPGLLESAYVHCLSYRLINAGLAIRREVPVPVIFESIKLECGYRADILVENKIIIEAKSIESIAPIHLSQTLTYLRFLNLKLGLILNFNSYLMKDGIKRVANNL